MSADFDDLIRARVGQRLPSEEFVAYCEAEFERRVNSGQPFDEAAYREAMEMALATLRNLESEGVR